MGWLDLICITTDPASTTFYRLAYATDYSTDSTSKYVVLIRSNTNPISPRDLVWSIVSLIESWKLAGHLYTTDGSDCTCSSGAQDVFTMFGRALSDSTSGLKRPYGIRYNLSGSMDDSFNYRRPGAWQNITVAGGYDWSGGLNRHSLGYVNNGATKVLVHASISDTNNTVNLAMMNDSTMDLYGTGLWVMIYSSKDFSTASMFLTIKDPNTLNGTGIVTKFDADVINMDFFTFIGDGSGDGASTFELLKKEETMYGFGNNGGLRYTHMIDKVNATETYGINPNLPPPPAAPIPTILSKAGVVGIVFRAFVLAVLTFLLGRKTSGRNRKMDDDEVAESDAKKSQPSQPLDGNKDDPPAQGPKEGANSYDLEAAAPNDFKQQHAEEDTEKLSTKGSAPWLPTQYIPPARPFDSGEMPSPSAPAYASVVHQLQSLLHDSQSVALQDSAKYSENEVSTPTPPSTADFAQCPTQS
ncbi:hypothetical protein KI688_009095 [Linnemannia hyalina]|uniref:Uncharacterized protein n=1 Tax=Linnemannia hyalina TaxID=64524 RepID=A0A9P7XYS6_9FUNG|nr:hypothetical protein KI688_009095 [Linnemannia hyalina]